MDGVDSKKCVRLHNDCTLKTLIQTYGHVYSNVKTAKATQQIVRSLLWKAIVRHTDEQAFDLANYKPECNNKSVDRRKKAIVM
ncbi:hypothetical protein DPSP01_013627 [Paraphaeosphaeria sporulosa]